MRIGFWKSMGRVSALVCLPVLLAAPARDELKPALLAATRKALELELEGYTHRLDAARNGPGSSGNIPLLESRIAEAKARLDHFRGLPLAEYPDPVAGTPPEPLGSRGTYGPIVPARRVTLRVTPTTRYREGSLLEVEGTTRSGPFYHLAGGDCTRLAPGRTYEVTAYLVYHREYVSFIPDEYVYLAEVK